MSFLITFSETKSFDKSLYWSSNAFFYHSLVNQALKLIQKIKIFHYYSYSLKSANHSVLYYRPFNRARYRKTGGERFSTGVRCKTSL